MAATQANMECILFLTLAKDYFSPNVESKHKSFFGKNNSSNDKGLIF